MSCTARELFVVCYSKKRLTRETRSDCALKCNANVRALSNKRTHIEEHNPDRAGHQIVFVYVKYVLQQTQTYALCSRVRFVVVDEKHMGKQAAHIVRASRDRQVQPAIA